MAQQEHDDETPSAEHEWFCGAFKREGLMKYVHMIRGPYDPERSSREARKGQTMAWRDKIKATTAKQWESKLLEHLSDGEPRTVNRLAVELLDQTADVCAPPLVNALWELHAQCKVECTNEAPIYFRIKGSTTEPAGKPGQMLKHGEKKTDEIKDEISRAVDDEAMEEESWGSDPDAEDAEPPKAHARRRAKPPAKQWAPSADALSATVPVPSRFRTKPTSAKGTLDALAKKSIPRDELKKKWTTWSKSTELQRYGYQIVMWFDPVAKQQLVEFVPRATEKRGHQASVHPRVTVTSREDQLAFHQAIGAPPPSDAPPPKKDADNRYEARAKVPESILAESISGEQLKKHGYSVVGKSKELGPQGYDTLVWYNPDDMTSVHQYVSTETGDRPFTVSDLETQLVLHKALGAPAPAQGLRLKSMSVPADVTLSSATEVYVPTDGSPVSVAGALWALVRGRVDPIIVFWPEKCAPVTRDYVENFAKIFGLRFFAGSLAAATKKFGKAGSITISDAETLEAAAALTKRGASRVTAPFACAGGIPSAYELLDTAGVRYHPSFVLAPDHRADSRGSAAAQADPCKPEKAAKHVQGEMTFEKALASSTILSGAFPENFVLYDNEADRPR